MNKKILVFSILLAIASGTLLVISRLADSMAFASFLGKAGFLLGIVGGATVWGSRRLLGEARTNVLLKNISILGVTLLIMFLVGEYVIRFVFKEITTTSDNTSYFAGRWKKNHERLNNLKFREREFNFMPSSGSYRIAIIGDSITYGQGVEEKNRFSNLIGEYLNTINPKYEVLNFGRPGAETVDHLSILKEVVLSANPNYIILQWFINDFEGQDYSRRPTTHALIPSATLHSVLHQSSALYYLMNLQWISLQGVLGFSGSYSDYMIDRFGDRESPGSRTSIKTLKEFINLCLLNDIPVSIVLFPSTQYKIGREYPYNFLHDRVLETCMNQAIICVDLRSTYASHQDSPETRGLWVNQFDAHPNSLANRLAAERLFDVLAPIWLSDAVHG